MCKKPTTRATQKADIYVYVSEKASDKSTKNGFARETAKNSKEKVKEQYQM